MATGLAAAVKSVRFRRARASARAGGPSPHLGRAIVLSVISVTGTVGFYGFMSWVPTLPFERGFSVVRSLTFVSVISVCNPLGALLAADLMERFERKWFNAAASFTVVACGLAYGFSSDPTWIMVFGALVVIGLQAGATGSYIYASSTPRNCFPPTCVRSAPA